jgi:hypothetical protein
MPSTPGIGTTATRGSRAQRREQAARVVPDTTPTQPAPVPLAPPQQSPTPEAVAQQESVPAPAPQRPAAPAPNTDQPAAKTQSSALTANGLGLEPKRGPAKEILNTRVLASTSKRLEWFTSKNGYAVTNVVDVALQEFLNKAGVPEPDANGNISG